MRPEITLTREAEHTLDEEDLRMLSLGRKKLAWVERSESYILPAKSSRFERFIDCVVFSRVFESSPFDEATVSFIRQKPNKMSHGAEEDNIRAIGRVFSAGRDLDTILSLTMRST